MSETSLPAVLWPTPLQELVLEIAIGPPACVAPAFAAWKAEIELDDYFGHATFRLLPLMFQRLHAMGVADPVVQILRGVYRKAWCEMQSLNFATAPVLQLLANAGIETMLIKGAALQRAYYRNAAVRPMSDLDIVVRPHQAEAAIDLLEAHGWVRNETARGEDLAYRHSMMFRDAAGREMDLHWHLLREACSAAASAQFWDHSVPLEVGDIATRGLCHADMLLHTVIHGLRANREPPIRWIADAITIIRESGEDLDWDRLIARAKVLRLTSRLRLGLDYLAVRFEAPIPPRVLARLARLRPSWVERVENSVLLADTDRLYTRALTKPWVIFAEYVRVADHRNPWRYLDGLSRYVCYRTQARGRRALAADLLRGLSRRAGRALHPS